MLEDCSAIPTISTAKTEEQIIPVRVDNETVSPKLAARTYALAYKNEEESFSSIIDQIRENSIEVATEIGSLTYFQLKRLEYNGNLFIFCKIVRQPFILQCNAKNY